MGPDPSVSWVFTRTARDTDRRGGGAAAARGWVRAAAAGHGGAGAGTRQPARGIGRASEQATAHGSPTAAYNLGLIYDRIEQPPDALMYLTPDLLRQVPESRHRLLIALYRARAFGRQGDLTQAQDELVRLQKERKGLKDWERIMESDQAEMLRISFADDVQLAAELMADHSLDRLLVGTEAS